MTANIDPSAANTRIRGDARYCLFPLTGTCFLLLSPQDLRLAHVVGFTGLPTVETVRRVPLSDPRCG